MIGAITRTLLNNRKGAIDLIRMSSTGVSDYKTLAINVPKPFVYHVELNRPQKLNSVNHAMWIELGKCFDELSTHEDCRAVVVTGSGKLFTAGIDFGAMMELAPKLAEASDVARKAKILYDMVKLYQYAFTSMELCKKPVISAVHSACIGAGVDLVTATDIRYCTKDAYYQVKEVDLGMAADVGTLQRLPKVIGSESLVRDLCFTGRKLPADEALSCGLVSKVFDTKESMVAGAVELAELIALKSPVAVQATKNTLIYGRDHGVPEGLDQIARLNQFLLQSEDFTNAVMGAATKQTDIQYSKL